MRRPWPVTLSVVLQGASLVCSAVSYVYDTQKALYATGLEILLLAIVILLWAAVAFFVFYGKNWARILVTMGLAFQVGGAIADAVSGTFSYHWSDYLGCAMSAVAVILLWVPVSRPFFAKPIAPRIDFDEPKRSPFRE